MRRIRPLVSAATAAVLALSLPGAARAQVVVDDTVPTTVAPPDTTRPPETTPTTAAPAPQPTPAPPTTAPATTAPAPTAATTAPPPTTATTAPPPTTTTTIRPFEPPVQAPAGGGDAAEAPGAPAPAIPPGMQALIDSVRRTGANSTAKLVDALAPLMAMGMSEQEAIQAGFGRFPVGGRATFTDDWWFPRFVPGFHLHEGTDIFAAYGTPARAPATGVLRQTFSPVGGLSVYVTEPDGTYYYLAHLSRFESGQVSGQAVRAGEVVGYVGDSGNARGSSPHVHFEVHRRGGGPSNPKPLLDAWLREALDAVPATIAAAAPTLADRARATASEEQELGIVGHSDLGGKGGHGVVAVVGRTALVASGDGTPGPAPQGARPCQSTVSVVDLGDPSAPALAASIVLARGQRVEDVDALGVRTPAFSGDLAAVVVGPCTPGDGGTSLEFYDVTAAARPVLLGRVPHPRRLADDAESSACGPVLRGTCVRADRTVNLRVGGAGRVLSLSSAASETGTSPDVFAVDLADPRTPRPLGFAPLNGRNPAGAADDGCSPVRLGDAGPRPPSGVRPGATTDVADFDLTPAPLPADALALDAVADLAAVADGDGRRLAVAPEATWWASVWALRTATRPGEPATDRPGCPRPMFGATPATAAHAGAGPTAGELVYVGRGCPARRDVDGTALPADTYVTDPAGKIAVADAALAPTQPELPGPGCTAAARLARARQAGALGLVVASTFLADPATPAATGPTPAAGPGVAAEPGSPVEPIPALQLRKPDGDAVRDALCLPAPAPGCSRPGDPVAAEVVETGAEWGGLRVLDVTGSEGPRQVQVFRTANASAGTPTDPEASYAVEDVVADGSRVYAAWGSDGLRVLELGSGSPVEVAAFNPHQGGGGPGARPAPSRVTGVGFTQDHIVVADRATGLWVLEKRPPAGTRGYWLADAAGGVHAFGDAAPHGSAKALGLNGAVVGMAPTPTAGGYWLATADGGVYAFGDAVFAGARTGAAGAPVVAIAPTPSGRGYWLAAADGGVSAFGDAADLGSLTADRSSTRIVALLPTPTGRGYRLIGADGGVFAFGDADFLGSMGGGGVSAPIVGAAATGTGRGYWLAASDGGVYAFGDARFKGSAAGGALPSPVTGVAAMTGVRGYWLAGAGGGVQGFGAPFLGARTGDDRRSPPVVAIVPVPRPPAAAPAQPTDRPG